MVADSARRRALADVDDTAPPLMGPMPPSDGMAERFHEGSELRLYVVSQVTGNSQQWQRAVWRAGRLYVQYTECTEIVAQARPRWTIAGLESRDVLDTSGVFQLSGLFRGLLGDLRSLCGSGEDTHLLRVSTAIQDNQLTVGECPLLSDLGWSYPESEERVRIECRTPSSADYSVLSHTRGKLSRAWHDELTGRRALSNAVRRETMCTLKINQTGPSVVASASAPSGPTFDRRDAMWLKMAADDGWTQQV